MTAHEDAGAFADADVDLRDLRVAVGRGVGLVEQRHRLDACFADVQDQRRELVGADVLAADFGQGVFQHLVERRVFVAEVQGMFGVGGGSLHAVDDQLFERPYVLVAHAQHTHFCGFGFVFRRGGVKFHFGHVGQRDAAFLSRSDQAVFRCQRFGDAHLQRLVVEIGVGDGAEQRVEYPAAGGGVGGAFCAQRPVDDRLAPDGKDQHVHQSGGRGFFSADALDRTALVHGRLLTLKAKHSHSRMCLCVYVRRPSITLPATGNTHFPTGMFRFACRFSALGSRCRAAEVSSFRPDRLSLMQVHRIAGAVRRGPSRDCSDFNGV